jgi:hypothetical protein
MNTYNISVEGKVVLTEISNENIEENLKIIRGLVWTNGGSDKDITVSINTNEQHS